MLGAVIGDIVGSRFENHNHKSKDFELFNDRCCITDDTVMTLAVASAVMDASKCDSADNSAQSPDFLSTLSESTVAYMRQLGREYPDCGFGQRFRRWITSDDPKPYNSFGNGAAMRIAPVGFVARNEQDAVSLAEAVTSVTHNHPEGLRGAKAAAAAIVLARIGASKDDIRQRIATEYYPLDFTIASIRPSYRFDATCRGTVPQAIECFLESTSFEDAIRTAVSLGGESDTIAAITGAIAEAYYGIPPHFEGRTLDYLDNRLRAIYDAWTEFVPQRPGHPTKGNHGDLICCNITAGDGAVTRYFAFAPAATESAAERHSGELIRCCSVNIDNEPAARCFTTADPSIGVGDRVIVPIDSANNKVAGTVETVEYLSEVELHARPDVPSAIVGKLDSAQDGQPDPSQDDLRVVDTADLLNIDVLNESLYSYDHAIFSLEPVIRKSSSDGLFGIIDEFINSAPAAMKAAEGFKDKQELFIREDLIPKEIRQALADGFAEFVPCKGSSDSFYLQIRSAVKGLVVNGKEYGIHRKLKDVELGTRTVPADINGAMQCLAQQRQLNNIAEELGALSEACQLGFGRVIQGQRDDRLAKLISSRSSLIQGLAASDKQTQRQLLVRAVSDANEARATLAYQIKSDIELLSGSKPLSTDRMTDTVDAINTAIAAMNNAVQLSLYSYQALGEYAAQLAVAMDHRAFVSQVLLKRISRNKRHYTAWEIVSSSGDGHRTPANHWSLPSRLLDSYTAFIDASTARHQLEGASNE